jgi:hypothetical protein
VKKKKTTTSVTLFDGFDFFKNGDLHLFWWFCRKQGDHNNVFAFLYGDGNM